MNKPLITQESEFDFKANIEPDGEGVWLTVGRHSLYINRTPEGVIIDAYPLGREFEEATTSMQLWDADLKEPS